jgi:DNA-binding beta-propeller fold protein YncE
MRQDARIATVQEGRSMTTRRWTAAMAAALAVGGGGAAPAAAQDGPHAKVTPRATRDVLVVSNNWAGTADLVDPRSFKRLRRIDVVPDRAERIAEIQADATRTFYFDNIRTLVGEGHDQLVDDGFTSPDGRTVYFSRPSFADVVAIDIRSGAIKWRVPVDGYRADHMALSRSGRRLLVSASTANVVNVIDTRAGTKVASFASGDAPHESIFSRDGRQIYHASIGTVYTDTDDPSQEATKGRRVFQVVDARTYRVQRTIDMDAKLAEAGHPELSGAVRPMAISPDERFAYFQVSFYFGIVQYDLRRDRVVRTLDLPLGAARGLDRTEFLLDSAHHGLAMSPNGRRLCVAGTMSGYAAIVATRPLRLQRAVRVGRVPYWSASSRDGRHCFVSVAGDDRVAVVSFRTGREVASIRVGDHPQRMRTGVVRRSALRR